MKKILLFGAALALSCSAMAQKAQPLGAAPGGSTPPIDTNPPAPGWATAIGAVFQYVDRSQVPTGILEEYGFSNLDLSQYTGQASTPDNQADMSRWRRGYGALYRARFGPNAPAMPTLAQVNTTLEGYAADSLVELPALYYRYHRYRADAVAQNLVQVQNNQIVDVAGRSQSPYEARTAFVVAPTQNAFATNQLKFVLRSALYYSNTGLAPSSSEIDFGDGRGYLAVAWDTPLSVTYSTIHIQLPDVLPDAHRSGQRPGAYLP
ncbi:hypothetical protein [Hymenobacter algoricola]|uniref:Uncharacterized protein n=1 Tax=Hymenobacter algoricola TaxID=486267 RepID=A0ABP7MJH2_9BACT